MNKNKKIVVSAACVMVCLSAGYFFKQSGNHSASYKPTTEDALVAIVKNDKLAFERYLKAGGDIHAALPAIEGKKLTVAEAVAHYERVEFVKVMQDHKIPFLKQKPEGDMLTIAVTKNNPEMVKALLKEQPNMAFAYGEKKQNLLHINSESCGFKVTDLLNKTGKLSAESKTADGATALTAAARAKCLPVITYWKDQKADMSKLDGKGSSVISLLKKSKDAETKALVEAIIATPGATRSIASEKAEPVIGPMSFYKKRKIPKDELADHNSLVEPEIRPLDTDESAEHSEFAD